MKATKFLASGRGSKGSGKVSGFKSELANMLQGSTSLFKTEGELLEGKKKKVQLGRVLDDTDGPKERTKTICS